MESIRLFLVIVLVTGTVWEETSAFLANMKLYRKSRERLKAQKKLERPIKPKILEEVEAAFTGAKSEVKFSLAPSCGTLNSETLKKLDETLKVMMGGIIEMDMPESVTWKEAKKALNSNPLMIRQRKLSASRLGRISFDSVRVLGFTTDNHERKIQIHSWFIKLIRNADIIGNTDIDLSYLANMISKHTIDIMTNAFTDKIRKKTLIDIGILRFPDISQPYFTLYRINLMAKCRYNTYLLHQNEKSELVGFFQKEVYYPNEDYINKMSNDLIEHLLKEVEDLFSD